MVSQKIMYSNLPNQCRHGRRFGHFPNVYMTHKVLVYDGFNSTSVEQDKPTIWRNQVPNEHDANKAPTKGVNKTWLPKHEAQVKVTRKIPKRQ